MIGSHSSRVVYVCAAVAAGCLAAFSTQAQVQAAQTDVTESVPAAKHRVAVQVNQNDKGVMDLALNNARNIIDYYKEKGETVAVEIVTYGPGLHMLRADTSPVKDR
jgi:hypothetical protein